MQATRFDKTLKTFRLRQPFRLFSVRFVIGEVVDVDHPEAVIVRARAQPAGITPVSGRGRRAVRR